MAVLVFFLGGGVLKVIKRSVCRLEEKKMTIKLGGLALFLHCLLPDSINNNIMS